MEKSATSSSTLQSVRLRLGRAPDSTYLRGTAETVNGAIHGTVGPCSKALKKNKRGIGNGSASKTILERHHRNGW